LVLTPLAACNSYLYLEHVGTRTFCVSSYNDGSVTVNRRKISRVLGIMPFSVRLKYLLIFLKCLTYLLTYSMVQDIVEKLIVTQLFKQQPAISIEREDLLPCSQKPSTRPYHDSAKFSLSHRFLFP